MPHRPLHDHDAILDVWLPGAPAVLADIGGGAGALARRLAGRGHTVWLIDPQAPALPDMPGVWPLRAGAQALPLAPASLDGAVFLNALHHVPVAVLDTALVEARRVLRPGAPLVVIEPLAEGPLYELIRPVEDEAEVRAAAGAALDRAAAGQDWRLDLDHTYLCPVRFADAADCRARLVAVDPARAARVAALADSLDARFTALGRAEAAATVFDAPHRAVVLTPEG